MSPSELQLSLPLFDSPPAEPLPKPAATCEDAQPARVEPSAADELHAAPGLLTTSETAELLHVHVEYLRRMVREDRIPAHRFPGGREIRFLRDELIDWVRAQPGEDRSPSAEDRSRA